jgi:4-oxalocrotonate tautomerase
LRDVAGVAADDCHEVTTEHEPDDLNIVPDSIGVQRSSDAILVQLSFDEDCTLDQKRVLYAAIVHVLQQRMGLRPEDIAINVLDVKKDDRSFVNVIAHYVDAAAMSTNPAAPDPAHPLPPSDAAPPMCSPPAGEMGNRGAGRSWRCPQRSPSWRSRTSSKSTWP